MGSLQLTLCAGAVVTGALTVALTSVPASALSMNALPMDTDVSVSPSNPTPGSEIQVRARGCATGTSGTAAASRAFVADALLAGRTGELVGETRIRSTLTPGTYDVKVTCGGFGDKADDAAEPGKADEVNQADEATGTLTVVKKPPAPAPAAPSAHQSPTAPVSAGGGGTARLSSVEERAEGPGTPHTVVGLVLAGVAAVAVAMRSVRRRGR
ncbi:hypothetical protein [Streptomyces ureilyticus]|uniref:Secreted protein n=1 Tax=Streptomyces ureilyticus TaxID=1775131 RepID=A0ABX0E0R7_9ACTN|nr:hypothetical protein [Streptomyces ureilyticus]NGO47802.1 hypothetical protein [Streptomyces ureilyticus]